MRAGGNTSRLHLWRSLILLGALLYTIFSLIFLYAGRLNIDEGWYLYASKLVYHGALPYRDFAFTQTPLLPYLYGVPQIVQPGLVTGWLTSVLFSVIAFAGFVLAAHRVGGMRAAALTALLLGTFTYGVYFNAIVKTYALVSLSFALALLALTARSPNSWKYFAAAMCAVLAVMARLSALAFALPILLYAFIQARNNIVRASILAAVFAVVAAGLAFYSTYPQAVTWNLLSHHLDQWGDLTLVEKVGQVLTIRIPDWIRQYWPFVVLTAALAILASIAYRNTGERRWSVSASSGSIQVYGLGLALFCASHFVTGGWQVEYFVPAIMGFTPLLGSAAIHLYDQPTLPHSARRLLIGLLCLVPIGSLATYGVFNFDLSGGQTPSEELREVAHYLRQNSTPADQIITLTALWTAVEADRDVPPGFSMALFSFQDMDDRTAQALHLINCDLLTEALRNARVHAVVLTAQDREWLASKKCAQVVNAVLTTEYNRALQRESFGQRNETVEIFLRRR